MVPFDEKLLGKEAYVTVKKTGRRVKCIIDFGITVDNEKVLLWNPLGCEIDAPEISVEYI